MRYERNRRDSGMALIIILGMMLIFSLMMLGFYFMVTGEQKVANSNRDDSVAFYAAEGGLEKMSADLADLSATTPLTVANIQSLGAAAYQPVIPGVTYPIYSLVPAQSGGKLASVTGTIGGSGPLAGLQGIITPITLTAMADYGLTKTEVKLSRQVQDVAVPVFEFGIFSDKDLSFFAGPNFNFGGRVHTNGNLFLAEGNGNTLVLADKVTAYKDIVRTQLSNGWPTSSNYTGTVDVIESAGGCNGSSPPTPPCRPLGWGEGSVTGGPGSAANPNWQKLSLVTYNANIRNGKTGAKKLNLAIALAGAQPIDLIRRDLSTDAALVGLERFMNKASLRILLSDTAASLPASQPGNPTTDVNGYPAIVPLDNTLNLPTAPALYGYTVDPCHPPIALSPGPVPSGGPTNQTQDNDFMTPSGTPLLGGYIEIDMQTSVGPPPVWVPVTMEILEQGIEHPNDVNGSGTSQTGPCTTGGKTYYPILHLEQVNTLPLNGNPTGPPASRSGVAQGGPLGNSTASTSPYDYIPLNLYDTREGSRRDTNDGNIYMNGIMSYAELDVSSLQLWFACQGIVSVHGTCSGTQAVNTYGGYIVYFSDRRGNYDPAPDTSSPAANPVIVNHETGEYGNEDIVNAASPTGAPDGVLEPANYNGESPEDVNGNGLLDTYGAAPDPNIVQPAGSCIYTPGCAISPFTTVTANVARKNSVVFFRRALRIYHGSLGQLPPLSSANCTYPQGNSNYGGFTIAAENPVYVRGDYNADTTLGAGNVFNDQAGRCHVPAAVIGDAVTFLSNSWGTANSFTSPTSPSGRNASTTSYRMGIISGKNISFAQPTGYPTPQDFGTDGGVHNFLRYLENWGGQSFYYRGSIVSFYYSRQATGIYKCCTTVYSPPTRGENFDTDFQSLSTLPPGTPRFTDVNALSFEQALLPNQ